MIIKKILRIDKHLFISLVDLEKLPNNYNWSTFFEVIEAIGINYNDTRIICNMYIYEISVINAEKGSY